MSNVQKGVPAKSIHNNQEICQKTDTFLDVPENVYMNKAIRFEKELPAPFLYAGNKWKVCFLLIWF